MSSARDIGRGGFYSGISVYRCVYRFTGLSVSQILDGPFSAVSKPMGKKKRKKETEKMVRFAAFFNLLFGD